MIFCNGIITVEKQNARGINKGVKPLRCAKLRGK